MTEPEILDPADLRHDMHVNIVTFLPGGVIPFEETHVMEHGLYVLEGKAVYRLNRDWVEVEAGADHAFAVLVAAPLLHVGQVRLVGLHLRRGRRRVGHGDGHEQDDEHDAAGREHAAGTAQSRHGSRPGRHALRLRTAPVGRR